jgi:hypothetical protein
MGSHPEEFTFSDFADSWYDGKWAGVIRPLLSRALLLEAEARGEPVALSRISALPFLTDDEVSLFMNRFMSVQGETFTASVMRILLEEKRETEVDTFKMDAYAVAGKALANEPAPNNAVYKRYKF